MYLYIYIYIYIFIHIYIYIEFISLTFLHRYLAGAPGSVPKLRVAAAIGQHLGAGRLQRQPGQLHHRWPRGDVGGIHGDPRVGGSQG